MSEKQQGASISRKIFTTIALSMFLVGLPLGSYIYLKKGYEYQKEAMRDLRKDNQMNLPAPLTLQDGSTEAKTGDDYYLIGLLPKGSQLEAYSAVLLRLHEQFDLPDNLLIWTVFEGDTAEPFQQFQRIAALPQDTSQLMYWTASSSDFATFVEDLQLQPDEKSRLDEGLIVLVDDSLYVRRAFPFIDEQAMQHLVERTAILLPERSKPKPELRPKAEL